MKHRRAAALRYCRLGPPPSVAHTTWSFGVRRLPRHDNEERLMLSLQELSDRIEIQELIIRYSNAIDRRDFDGLDSVFTPDAYIDYRALGGIDGQYPVIKDWLGPALAGFPHYFHLVGNI